jgi:effector-binding domain-containing protein
MNSLPKIRLVLFITIFLSQKMVSFAQDKKENTFSAKIEIKEISAVKAVVIKLSIPSSEIGPKMGELYGKLYGYLSQQKIQPAGAPFAVYYQFDPKGNTTFETGVPVNASVNNDGDILYKEFPAMKVATTLYTGSYEKIGPTYEALEKFIKEKNLQPAGVSWEVYLTDPSTVKDPNLNQTVIYFPLK